VIVDILPNGGEGVDPASVAAVVQRFGFAKIDGSAAIPGHFAIRFRRR